MGCERRTFLSPNKYYCGPKPLHSARRPRVSMLNSRQGKISLNLFFHSSDTNSIPTSISNETDQKDHREAWKDLHAKLLDESHEPSRGNNITLPFSLSHNLQENEHSDAVADSGLTVRKLRVEDLKSVVSMCWDEFQTGPPTSLADFPFSLSRQEIVDWFDRFTFGPALELSLRMKILWSEEHDDHHVLVLMAPDGEDICGLVELSWQPPQGTRNPPPIPLPMSVKEAYSKGNGLAPPEGWVTNLLIAQRYRGRGYSKILMAAVESLAIMWGCRFIFLHAQPFENGRIAQALYHGLGYQLVVDHHQGNFPWMDSEQFLGPGMYIVGGVPLLFLRKALMS